MCTFLLCRVCLLTYSHSFVVHRTTFTTDETEGQVSGGETAQNRVQWRAAVPTQKGVQREPVPNGTQAPGAGQ